VPGEFSLTNYFLFIGKKSCSRDKLLTNRKRRFCWEPVLILAALRSLILFSLPRLLTRLPPNPHPASPSVVSLIPVPPRTPPHLILQASLPSPFWFPFLSNKPWTAARSPLPPRESAETDRVISGPERSWPGRLLLRFQVLFLIGAISSQPGCHSGRGRHLPGAHPSW